ncbi:MAG: nicotinate-nucleotide adenylyltransferase [Lachnospiraceae bacterium]|nr:nicotinate-nucleotide adenylyltransferase [Lachnospiraceae bacterium]
MIMKANKKVGIIGGTFNPIHIGHLILAEHAYDEYKLDEILFIPTGISHFKDPNIVLDKKKRITMTGGAIDDNPHFALSTIETDRPGNSYTYETLEELKRMNPDTEYYLIIGADSLFQIEQWKNTESIMKNASILVAVRKGQSLEELKQKADELTKKYNASIHVLTCTYIDVSSTEIRARIKEGKSIRYMVTDDTLNYINKFNLYRD